MLNWFLQLKAEDQLKALALLGASVAFVVSLVQYRKAQRWKRAEWVATEMDAFFHDPAVKTALHLIDWGAREVELHPNRDVRADRFVMVTDDALAMALMSHMDRPSGFTEDEVALRDIFDHFLDRLGRIQSFVKAGLITVNDVSPYLGYWAEQISCTKPNDSSVDRLVQLQKFIQHYGYTGVAKLLSNLMACKRSSKSGRWGMRK